QRQTVANYRRLLEVGDAAALDRELRDRRFLPPDSPSRLAFLEGEPLGARRIDRMVGQYRSGLLQLRAETIARTEALRTASLARQEALAQVLEQVEMPRDRVVRVWRATQDERTRDTHAEMDGQERGLDEPFESPSGAILMYPGDPAAPPAEVINCRCVLLHEFLPAE
ncbi:MAG: phage minor head protein, partial [Dehalococcoidia bacterium]|nr:phage minor head protein [Dehalococcoidia bacterium]